MYKFLPFLLIPILLLLFLFSSYLPFRREVIYRLGLSNDPTTSCCKEEQISQSGDFDESSTAAIFDSQIIDYPKTSLAQANSTSLDKNVLGTNNSAGEEKWIEVSLDEQKVRAWEGNRIVMEFLISSGKWAPTPKGTFYIWYKTRYQKMEGGSKSLGTYYNLPNVPNNMFFYKGYALHGAYWHNNFGQPMSHGCVNEPLDKAAAIFEWAGPAVPEGQNAVRATKENPGTKVFVH
ncbi:L,D-transpeptidase [Candidatus Daviesbacteria bacterium]|nr:L,D-transpeptidase [Candidatus Daviesbacteria bacterium]